MIKQEMKNIKSRSISSSFLKNRIKLNKKYQKSDFKNWQFKIYKRMIKKLSNYKRSSNVKILDIGSGDGLQVSHFLKIFKNPEIWCIDYSKKSLNSLYKKHKSKNIKIIKMDMDDLPKLIKQKKLKKNFDIVHSSYALYYAKKQKDVLKSMKTSLVENGILLVSAPSEPHEMVNFVNQIKKIPFKVLNTLKFFKNVLLPFLKKEKFKLLFELKTNVIKFDKKDEFIEFWKNTTYYNKMIRNLKQGVH